MNPGVIFVGLGGGIVSAILLMSAIHGSFGARLVLFFFGPLPLFLSGLGWGLPAAMLAALTGAGAAAGLLGFWPGFVFLISQGLPAVILTWLATRVIAVVPAGAGATAEPETHWVPTGHLIAGAAIIAGALAAGSFAVIAWEMEALRKGLREFITQMLKQPLPGIESAQMTPEEITAFADLMIARMPAAMALMWFVTLILNLWVAGRISVASGRLTRPWPRLSRFQLPAGLALALALSLAVSMMPGLPGLLGNAVSTACLAAYVLQGLAIIHHVTTGRMWRGFALAGTYAALLLTGEWGAYTIALIGLAEPISPLNRNAPARPA